MRRRATGSEQRSHREFDFLADVEPERLQALGAIGLAWNWIEGAIDTALCVALNLHPSMWLEVVGRVNGMDGKIALLKKQTRLYLDSIDKEAADAACKVFNAVENYKKLRDGVTHVRLTDPDMEVADTPQRRGNVDEVLVSKNALAALYQHLHILAREADCAAALHHGYWLMGHAEKRETRASALQLFQERKAQLLQHQRNREALPPLPEFPDQPLSLQETEDALQNKG